MGLDSVELVLRTEEFFAIDISDDEAAGVITVGDFYRLICAKLKISPLESPITPDKLPVISEREARFHLLHTLKPLAPSPAVLPWSPQSVWDCLVAIFRDQQSLPPQRNHSRGAHRPGPRR